MAHKKALLKNIFFLLLISIAGCTPDNKANGINWEQLPLEEGDIVFRAGKSMASKIVIASDTKGYYSHAGIIIAEKGEFKVIHAVPGESVPGEKDKVKEESLSSFFESDKAKSGCVMRYKLSTLEKQKVSGCAKRLFYKNTLFDHNYKLTDTTKIYCTELIWLAFKEAGIDISDNKRTYINFMKFKGDIIFPSDIFSNKKLKTIYTFNNH